MGLVSPLTVIVPDAEFASEQPEVKVTVTD
jgi:hypothetical protein